MCHHPEDTRRQTAGLSTNNDEMAIFEWDIIVYGIELTLLNTIRCS